jgi:hypothetical protein
MVRRWPGAVLTCLLLVAACSDADFSGSGPSSSVPAATATSGPTLSTVAPRTTAPPAVTAQPSGSADPEHEEGPPMGSDDTVYEEGDIDEGLRPFIAMATADLAARLDVEEAEITPLTAVLVVWPNGALGCPEPGMQYAQVLTDGSVIELGAMGRVFRYHSGGSTTPFLCERPLTSPPAAGGG